MVFDYPTMAHVWRHGPQGYIDFHSYKPWLRDEFTFRCVYCLRRERMFPDGAAAFSVDHFVPVTVDRDRETEYENLRYACLRCNSAKGQRADLLDPRTQGLGQHLQVDGDGWITGLTIEGARFIDELGLNGARLVAFRLRMLEGIRFLHECSDPRAAPMLAAIFGFPDDLPDLRELRPPGNTRPEGMDHCCFARRERGDLPETY
jgi:hypothetical protein